jgi:hypothetical protein
MSTVSLTNTWKTVKAPRTELRRTKIVCTLGRLRVARPSPSGPTTPGGKNLAPGASDAGLSQTHRARLDRASTQLVARTHEALLGASCDRARRVSRGGDSVDRTEG